MFKQVLLFLFLGSLFSCKNENERKMFGEVIITEDFDYTMDSSSGATALGSLENLKTKNTNDN